MCDNKEYKVRVYFSGYFDAEVNAINDKEAIYLAEYINPLDDECYREQLLSSLEIQPTETQILR